MSDIIKLPTLADVEEQAASWVWRLDDEGVTPEERTRFQEWLRRDPRNARAYTELGGVWEALDGLAEAKRDEKIATFTAQARQAAPGRRRARHIWSIAASVVAIAIGILFWLQRADESQVLATAVGQQRTVRLADGSTVYLNTNTILETDFASDERKLRLLKGEASFSVAPDADRPFVVRAGTAVVRALGTDFNVRMRSNNAIEVIVADGRVAVARASGEITNQDARETPLPLPTDVVLTRGERFDTGEPARVSTIQSRELANSLAWRSGTVVFEHENLADAIAELNRYTETRFIATDPAVQKLSVGGQFKPGDVEGFLKALEAALPVTTRRASDNIVYIEPRPMAEIAP